MKLHNIIDKLNPELRSIDNIDGKKRVREFYAITKEDAYSIFDAIAQINGLESNLHLVEQSEKEKQEEREAKEISNDNLIYSEDYHLENIPQQIKDLYVLLKTTVLSKMELEVVSRKMYLAFKHNGKNIFDIKILKSKLWLWINMPSGTLKDEKEFTRDVSNIGHQGNGDYDLTFSNEKEIEYVLGLIKQSFDYNN